MTFFDIDPEFEALCPPLAQDERSQLEANLLEYGCLDPLIVWEEEGLLLDGHNRYGLCSQHQIPFEIVELSLPDREAAIAWIAGHQLGRRNLSPEQASYLRGKRYQSERGTVGKPAKLAHDEPITGRAKPQETGTTAERLADQYGVSPATIKRDSKYAEAVDELVEAHGPEIKEALFTGNSDLSKAELVQAAENPESIAVDPDTGRIVRVGGEEGKGKEGEGEEKREKGGKKTRIPHDYYPTPESIVRVLLDRVPLQGRIVEPCAGHGAIAALLPGEVITNEPYPMDGFQPDYCDDATRPEFWACLQDEAPVDWVVTNPPYEPELCLPILQAAYDAARIGVAFLLRLNYLEPCGDRALWLDRVSPTFSDLIVLSPRPRFRKDTNGGDSITVAWCVWNKLVSPSCCEIHHVRWNG